MSRSQISLSGRAIPDGAPVMDFRVPSILAIPIIKKVLVRKFMSPGAFKSSP